VYCNVFLKLVSHVTPSLFGRQHPVLKHFQSVRYQVLTAVGMKIIALWDRVLCSLVDVDRRLGGAYCLHNKIALIM
jgi:hypothetical protein